MVSNREVALLRRLQWLPSSRHLEPLVAVTYTSHQPLSNIKATNSRLWHSSIPRLVSVAKVTGTKEVLLKGNATQLNSRRATPNRTLEKSC